MLRKVFMTFIRTFLPLILGFYLVWRLFSGMSESESDEFFKAVRNADYFWIFLALLLGVSAYFVRGYRWKYMLEPLGYKASFWNRYHAVMIGYLVNLTIPRAGEASRCMMLFRSDGVPFSKSFGTIIAERAVDFVALSGVVLVTFLLNKGDFIHIFELISESFGGNDPEATSGILISKIVFGVVIAAGLAFAYLIVFRASFRAKIRNFFTEVLTGLTALFKSNHRLAYLGLTLWIWGAYIVMFILPFYALRETENLPVSVILLAFIAGSVGIMFTNGGIGTFPLLVSLVVAFYLKSPNAGAVGNAIGMIIWTSQTLLMILLGLISLVLLPKNYTKENEQTGLSQ